MNCPYGRALPVWANKIVDEAARGCEIIALVPARTDTRWWQLLHGVASSTLLWRGRIKFRGATAGAPFPSAVFAFGDPMFTQLFRAVFAGRGVFV